MSAIIHVNMGTRCPRCRKFGAQVVGHSQREVDEKIARREWGPCMECGLKAVTARVRRGAGTQP